MPPSLVCGSGRLDQPRSAHQLLRMPKCRVACEVTIVYLHIHTHIHIHIGMNIHVDIHIHLDIHIHDTYKHIKVDR